jgi:hypothetical protein
MSKKKCRCCRLYVQQLTASKIAIISALRKRGKLTKLSSAVLIANLRNKLNQTECDSVKPSVLCSIRHEKNAHTV